MCDDLPKWNGTLKEWRDAVDAARSKDDPKVSQGRAAVLLDCGKRRVQGIERGEDGYRLSVPDLVFMAVYLRSISKKKGEEFLRSQPITAG